MNVTSLGLATDLMVLRLSGSLVQDRGDYLVAHTPDNPNYWNGNLLVLPGPPAPSQIAGWLDVFAAELPTVRHVTIGIDRAPTAPTGTTGAPDWAVPWAEHGLEYEGSTVLTADAVHEPPHPNRQAHCRPLASPDDWRQLVELRCDNNTDLEPTAYRAFTERSVRNVTELVDRGAGQWFGAFLDGRLVSTMGLFSDGSGVARFQSVDTHPQARRLGLAGTLVHHVGRWGLTELGAHTLVMVADPHAEAIRVYRSVGFVDQERQHQLQRAAPGERLAPARSADR